MRRGRPKSPLTLTAEEIETLERWVLAELGAEQVLSAVAAGEREIGRPVSAAAREVGDDLRVLVVGMGGDVEHAAHGGEAAHLLQDHALRRWLGGVADVGGTGQDGHAEGGPERHVPAAGS